MDNSGERGGEIEEYKVMRWGNIGGSKGGGGGERGYIEGWEADEVREYRRK